MGIKMIYASRMAYRIDFVISSTIMLLAEIIIPFITLLIYRSGAAFPGWSLYELLLIQGVFMMSRGLSFAFFYGVVWSTLSAIREGTFDVLLLKPHSPLHLSIATSFSCDDFGVFVGGAVLSGVAIANLPRFGLLNWVGFLLLLFMAVLILASFAIIMSATVFKWVGNSRVYEIVDSMLLFGQYPLTIFSRPVAGLITWVLPIAMVAFIPASVLLGRPPAHWMFSILASLLLFVFSVLLWRGMQRHYMSAGG